MSSKYQTVSGRQGSPKVFRLRNWRWFAGGAFLAYLFIYPIPVIGTLVFASLHVYWNPTNLPPITLYNYQQLLDFPAISQGVVNSILVSLAAALAAVALSFFVAYTSARPSNRLARGAGLVAFFPFAFPTIVLGVGLLWAFAYSPIPIYGTLWALILAYAIRYVPIASRFLGGPLLQIGGELEEMSRICGATLMQSLRRVVIPILRPTMVAAAVYVFIVSIKDLGAAVMLVTSNSVLFSASLYTIWSSGELLQAAAAGVAYVVVLSAVLFVLAVVVKVNLFSVLGAEAGRGRSQLPPAHPNKSTE